MKTRAFVLALAFCAGGAVAQTGEIFAISNGGIGISRVELPSQTVTYCGNVASGAFTTNLAMDANRKLYYMNPFEGSHALWTAELNASNQLVNQQLEVVFNTPGYGVIDGFTISPTQKLVMTGYGDSQIYTYTPGSMNPNLTTEVSLVGGGEYRSDLAFDPLTGAFVGIGIAPDGSGRRSLFQIPSFFITNGVNDNIPWEYYGGAGSPWSTIDLRSTLGGNPDGIAFDTLTGQLYLSGDGERLSEWNRAFATPIQFMPNGQEFGLGWDLAYQQVVPAPGMAGLLAFGGLAATRRRRA